MAHICRLGSSMTIKSCVDQMHEIWSSKLHHIPNICPDKVKSVDLLEGEWGKEGCVICWNFIHEERTISAKGRIEVIDKQNKMVVYKAIEGGPMDQYKSFKWIFQGFPKDNLVSWTLEYEKGDSSIPDPSSYLEFGMIMNKEIDAHLTRA